MVLTLWHSLLFAFWVGGCLEGYEEGMRGDNKVVCSSHFFSFFYCIFPFNPTLYTHPNPPPLSITLYYWFTILQHPFIIYHHSLSYLCIFSHSHIFSTFLDMYKPTSCPKFYPLLPIIHDLLPSPAPLIYFLFSQERDVCNIFLTFFNIFFFAFFNIFFPAFLTLYLLLIY